MKNLWILVIFTVLIVMGCSESSTEPEIVSIEREMLLVTGGSFEMGNDQADGNANEYPQHAVSVGSFYMSNREVTQGEFTALMGNIPADRYGIGDNYPVYQVTWEMALEYCNLLSEQEGLTPCYNLANSTCNWSADGYRLPTEAEWEFAVKGGSENVYPGSDDINDVAWYYYNSDNQAHEVALKAPNALGFYDMSGNVWEWCWDYYSDSYYSRSETNNPHGPSMGERRVVRGGCWFSDMYSCCCSFRSVCQSYGSCYIGFRVVRNAESNRPWGVVLDTHPLK